MESTLTITIGDTPYTIRPLTVGQLEEMHAGVLLAADADPQKGVRDWWKQSREIIGAALAEDHPSVVSPEAIKKLRIGSYQDAKRVRDQILVFAGFIDPPKEGEAPPQGEATAAAE